MYRNVDKSSTGFWTPAVRGGISNGRKAGRPKGIPMPIKPMDHEEAINAAVERALTGKRITPGQFKASSPTNTDCERLTRALGMSIEEFNQKLAQKLAVISDKIAGRIEEKIDNDEFRPGELGFIFAVTEDKRRALDARAQLGSAQVNIQVNNYGDKSRDEIIAALLPQPGAAPAFDVPVVEENKGTVPVISGDDDDETDIDINNLKPEDVI